MGIKKPAFFLAAAMLCLLLLGCAAARQEQTAAEIPTPEPKEGIEAVFGGQVTLAVISNAGEAASALFFNGAQREAESLGIKLTTTAAEDGFDSRVTAAVKDGADAIIAYLPEKAAGYGALQSAAEKGIPVCVFEMQKGDVPAGISHLFYEAGSEADIAMGAALTYPPHDAPVRLILMFESKQSAAYKAYQKLYDEGKIFPKEVYIASEDSAKAPGEWLSSKLGSYEEGMLDGVFAENANLAAGAFDALEELKWPNMELLSAGLTPETLARMEKAPEIFAQAAGANAPLAGVLSVRAALNMLKGGESVTLALEPTLANARDLGQDGANVLAGTGEQAALYKADWMDALREDYKK